jgi:hypothetical protein
MATRCSRATERDAGGRDAQYHRHVGYDADEQIAKLKVGPDISDLVETLKAACLMVIWAAEPFPRAFDLESPGDQLQSILRRFRDLPQEEPPTAAVRPNF